MNTTFKFEELVSLLRRSVTDPVVRDFFGDALAHIKREEYYGFLEFRNEGVAAVFNEASWVFRAAEITEPKELYTVAFHLYSDGDEGYAQYTGHLPKGIAFGDSETELFRKMGPPLERGGGQISAMLKRPWPHWLRYASGDAFLRLQLDVNHRVEMVTIEGELNGLSRR